MCGLAGIIHRGKSSAVGSEMTDMLQSLKHRGPDSTGFAIYGIPEGDDFIMRVKVAEADEMASGFHIHQEIKDRFQVIDDRMAENGVHIKECEQATKYSRCYRFTFGGDMQNLMCYIEDVEGAEILSVGHALQLIKDLGDATVVSDRYKIGVMQGTHALGHTRMATESDVDIRSAHPYWAFPYNDVSVVHNGQITNYWLMRRDMERQGHRFVSNCDSELLAVYVAHHMAHGIELEDVLRRSIDEIDGVFTYLVATADKLGMAKDCMAAKPMVLYESNDLIVMASEEVAIRAVLPYEIDTYDPYDEEVKVWQA
ncbi:MAG: glutamine amidotransferase [Alphaproteobacteria bacterium]|nr:glutamine amidotransferase [Alphaproteobacteria bacterium]